MEDEAMSQCSIMMFSQISSADSEENECENVYEKLKRKSCIHTYLIKCYSKGNQRKEGEIKDLKLKFAEAIKGLARVREKEDLAKEKKKVQEKAKKLLAIREYAQQIHETCDNTVKKAKNLIKRIKDDKPDSLVIKHRELKLKLFETDVLLKLLLWNPQNHNVISNGPYRLVAQIKEFLLKAKAKDQEKCENPYLFDDTRVENFLPQSTEHFFDELEKVGINCFKEEEKAGKCTIDQNQMQSEIIDINKVEPTIETKSAKSSRPVDLQFSNGSVTAATLCNKTTDNHMLDNYPHQSSSGKIMKIPTSKNSSQEKIDEGLDSVALRNAETSTAHIAQRSSKDSLSM